MVCNTRYARIAARVAARIAVVRRSANDTRFARALRPR